MENLPASGHSALIDNIFDVRQRFIVLGLTGQTGAGCSSTAGILTKKNFAESAFPEPVNSRYEDNQDRRYRICYEFLRTNWQDNSFEEIRVRDILAYHCFKQGLDTIIEFVGNIEEADKADLTGVYHQLNENIRTIISEYNNLPQEKINDEVPKEGDTDDEYQKIVNSIFNGESKYITRVKGYVTYHLFTTHIRPFTDLLKAICDKHGSYDNNKFQIIGNNLRQYGHPFGKQGDADYEPDPFTTAESIRDVINAFMNFKFERNERCQIVIDAIRNPLEAYFLKERFSSFYLVGVTTKRDVRQRRLLAKNMTLEGIKALDEVEQNKEKSTTGALKLMHQDISKCLEAADIFLANDLDDNEKSLKKQIITYLSLIMHPGIVTPSPVERCMQIAYTSKLNSGCISRQVGAVVTDADFSVKAIGWNDSPKAQVPCLLRNYEDFYSKTRESIPFSQYELNNEKFRKSTTAKLPLAKFETVKAKGLNPCFCFKDAQNAADGKNNQVHTRALHAEENAFLQLTKYGGQGVQGGYLFTTASPCELCSKKAFQLGIAKVYYIDPYPGIAEDHVLGYQSKPDVILFSGAIGRAYVQLYQPIMNYKDELHYRLGGDPFAKSAE